MTELKDVIATLDEAADSFETIATKEQKKLYEEVITLAKDLDVDATGKVKQSIANLKRLTQIKAKLAALSKDKDWVAGITGFAKYFGTLQMMQNKYYSDHFPEHTLSEDAKKKNDLMRQMAVQNTVEALMGDGLKANVTDKLNDILLRAVTTGTKFADLQEELRGHLMGVDGGTGALTRYATTYATTALNQYTGQHNKLLTDDLDTEWFMYTGSNKETTREFCEQLTKKKYIHKSEIPTILTGRIDDYQCAIYPKTNLPYGMIDGTTPENFQCNCGGWNCRHQLVPVADAVVPAALRAKFAKTTKPSGKDISMQKGTDAFNNLLRLNGWDDASIKQSIKDLKMYGVSFEYSEDMTASQIKRIFDDAQQKAANAQIVSWNRYRELDEMWDFIHTNFPDKYQDIKKEIDEHPSYEDSLINHGFKQTNEWVNKTRKRIYGIVDRLADIVPNDEKSNVNTYSKDKLKKGARKLNATLNDPMPFSRANSGSVNPLFTSSEDVEYGYNCQRCALTFEMRCRGLDVSAGAGKKDNDDFFQYMVLPYGDEIWINTKTKKAPTKTMVRKDTLQESLDAFNAATKESGRYILYAKWKTGSAHNFNFIRNKRGVGFFYDGQNNYTHTFEEYYNDTDEKVSNALYVWRVDDCDLDDRYYSLGGVFNVAQQ